jgi:hypothetical protein
MRKMSSKKRYVVSERCSRQCSLHPDNLTFSDETTEWYNAGWTVDRMVQQSVKLGRKLSTAALSRHRRHLVEEADTVDESGENLSHLQVLEKIIAVGAKRAHTWRIGASETLKAIEMHNRLTQGAALADLMGALTMAADEIEEENNGTVDIGSLSPSELQSVGLDAD